MILICEPICCDFEHAEVNAALIIAVEKAFPREEIILFAEKGHLDRILFSLPPQIKGKIERKIISIPKRNSNDAIRFIGDWKTVRGVLNYAKTHKADKILFTSILSPSLISIKIQRIFSPGPKMFIVVHSILSTIKKLPKRWYLLAPLLFWFRNAIVVKNKGLNYIVYGEFIKENVIKLIPKLAPYLRVVDLPYLYSLPPSNELAGDKDVIKFAYFGVLNSGKRSQMLNDIIQHVRDKTNRRRAEFVHIGKSSQEKALTREEFSARAAICDYAIYLHSPETYALTASGSLFDAFSYVKPVIALRTPLFEYYFKKMGNIGYLFNNIDEMSKKIISILNDCFDNNKEYEKQLHNIIAGREKISLDNIAEKIKNIMEKKNENSSYNNRF